MRQTDGTIHSTGGFPRITGAIRQPSCAWRACLLTVLLGSILTSWVSRTTWQRLDNLEGEFAALKAESFYLGVHMRGGISD